MKRILHQMAVVVILLLSLGQPAHGAEWNPTDSDANGNTAGGTNALVHGVSSSNGSTAFGYFALHTNAHDYNTAFGYEALKVNTTGNSNTASGYQALRHNTSGDRNTASGYKALYQSVSGDHNTASGYQALGNNTTGDHNTANGSLALYHNTTGKYNTANGSFALFKNTTGKYNTASGYHALYDNTTGENNTASGRDTLWKNTTGVHNSAFGRDALKNLTSGDLNLALGSGAGSSLTSGNANIYLGHSGVETESNTMRLGLPPVQTRTFVAGVAATPVTGSAVFIATDGQLGVQVSSARFKQDIEPLGKLSEPLHQLRPVAFHYRQEPQGPRQYGLIAEEVAAVYPELVTRDTHGEVQGVRYEALIPLLLNELQLQHCQLTAQADRIDAQARQMSAVFEQLAELRAQNESLRAALGHPQRTVVAQSTAVTFDQANSR